MTTEEKQRWDELCGKAASEKDSEKLLLIKREMDRMLVDKHQRLGEAASDSDGRKTA